MSTKTRFRIIRTTAWALSTLALIAGLAWLRDPTPTSTSQTLAALLVEAGGAFFFAFTVGWVLEKLQQAEGYSVLWLLSQEFRKAGVLAFYSDREGEAKRTLEEAFEKHIGGDVLMAGASLRLFLGPGLHFQEYIKRMLAKEGKKPITVRAVSCSSRDNHELPVRSFVEEFNQDGTTPKTRAFKWENPIDFSFANYEKEFFEKHGVDAPVRCRVIQDLENVRAGVTELKGVADSVGNSIERRESKYAPYCTVIIFPDKAFYTPNLLCTEVPVNMPTIVFHKSSDTYGKLVQYFEFLWWVSDSSEERAM